MNTNHTPGPWSFKVPKEGTPDITISTRIQTKGPHSFGQTIPMYITRVYGTGEHIGPTNQERLANAYLIASAPELLEALKILTGDFKADIMVPYTDAVTMAKQAIAKAEGRE